MYRDRLQRIRSWSKNPSWKRKKERRRNIFSLGKFYVIVEKRRGARTSTSSSVGFLFFFSFFRLAHRGQKLGNLNSRARKPLELVRWTSSGLSSLSFPPKSTREDPSHSNVRGYGHECSWIHAGARRWTHRGLTVGYASSRRATKKSRGDTRKLSPLPAR